MTDLALGALLGAGASLLVSVMFEEPVTATVEKIGWQIRNIGDEPSCKDTGWYRQVLPIRAAAHSELWERGEANQWRSAHRTHDGLPYTAWLGEDLEPELNWISYSFEGPPQLAFACLINGDIVNTKTYFGNGRVEEFQLEDCGETRSIALRDLGGTFEEWDPVGAGREHQIDLNCETGHLTLRVLSSHPQDRQLLNHELDTVSIAEVRFFEVP